MRTPKLVPLPAPVADLRQRIEHWRLTRTKRGRMARDLWAEAAGLARQHGVHAIAKALRLNYEALKAWSEDSPKKKRQGTARFPGFVQLDPLPGIPSASSVVEVQSPGGAKLTIRLSGPTALDAVALVNTFLGGRR
jgi:hypothetical protein